MSSTRRSLVSLCGGMVACGVVGAVLLLPSVAQAASPICRDRALTTLPGQALTVPEDLCSDPDGDPLTPSIAAPPHDGTVTQQGDSLVYEPDASFVGTDTFRYQASDGTNDAVATVTVIVDTAPTCSDLRVTLQTGRTLTLSEFPCDDADPGEQLDIYIDDPQSGQIDISPSGDSVTYTPNPGFVGTDSLKFFAGDQKLRSDTATLTIVVTAPPAQPGTPPSTPPRDTRAPSARLAAAGTQKLRNVIAGGLKLDLTANEAGSLRLTVQVDKATARKLRLDRKAKGPVTIGRLNRQIAAGKTKLVVKFAAKARAALKRARKVTLKLNLTITDAAGNATIRAATLKLKR